MPPLKIIVTGWVCTLVANICLTLPGFDSQHPKKINLANSFYYIREYERYNSFKRDYK